MSAPSTPVPALPLGDGIHIPQVGFGVFQVPPGDTEAAVTQALEAGYRHIDTAAAYRNEEGVGRAIAASGLPRDDIFVTTKLWNSDQGHDEALRAFDASIGRLGLDQLDLYLVHWPAPAKDRYADSWQALTELREDGRVRAIGVSNFLPEHLERVIDRTGVTPALNQVELHPRLQQGDLRAVHERHGIVTEAWSPLAQGGDLLEDPTITAIAEAHDRTPAQVILRWHVGLGNVVIPKSVTPERIRSNLDLFGFELTAEDMDAIGALDRGERIGPDPATFTGG